MAKHTDCPCTSRRPYRDCCEPYHRGEREAETAEILMRSRFAAFARKDAAYLMRTTHVDHEDHALPEGELARRFKASASSHKYMALRILDSREADDAGISRVLFLARVFEKGRDRSFVELSEFMHDGVGFRYLRGETIILATFAGDPEALTIATFSR